MKISFHVKKSLRPSSRKSKMDLMANCEGVFHFTIICGYLKKTIHQGHDCKMHAPSNRGGEEPLSPRNEDVYRNYGDGSGTLPKNSTRTAFKPCRHCDGRWLASWRYRERLGKVRSTFFLCRIGDLLPASGRTFETRYASANDFLRRGSCDPRALDRSRTDIFPGRVPTVLPLCSRWPRKAQLRKCRELRNVVDHILYI